MPIPAGQEGSGPVSAKWWGPGFADRLLSPFTKVEPGEGLGALMLAANVFMLLTAYYILKTVRESAPGSVWAVGTEVHLVNRLAQQMQPEKTVMSLDPIGCLCSTMFRVSPNHLLWVLEGLLEGKVHNRIVVPEHQKHWTKVALDRMLSVQ